MRLHLNRESGTIRAAQAVSMAGSTTISSPNHPQKSVRTRRFPVGAEYLGDGRVHFRVWAPGASSIDVVVEGSAPISLAAGRDEEIGYFGGEGAASPGARYQF